MSDLNSRRGGGRDDSPGVHRILFVSADMGAGHNATARAVEQAAKRLWPDAETRWIDTLDVMGPGVGPTFRRIYVTNVQTTPWLYEFFYDSLWRHRWFATASKRFVGAWCGRLLAAQIEGYAPDLIVSTYPLGSAGLQWLRDRRGLNVPVAAWISDFAPHPFWVYPDLDLHFVMHDACVRPAKVAEPTASVQVAAPPVGDDFVPADRAAAREKLGLDPDAFVAVLSCGYFGFGTVEKAVDTLLATDPRVQIVAVCGQNEQLRQRVAARGAPGSLHVLGWVEDMASYVAAADVVVTNAGGATSLEAMACGRTVLMFEPIAAHGRANAELMASAGLALLCRTPDELQDAVRGLLAHPDRLARFERVALERATARTREDDLRFAATGGERQQAAAVSARRPRRRRMQPEDAFFLYAETPAVNQMLGGVVYLEGHVSLEAGFAEIERRLGRLPNLRRRLVAGRPGWRRPAWLSEDRIDLHRHVRERVLGAAGEPATFAELIDDFFSTPLDLRRQPWELHLVQGLDGNRSGILVKLHHVLGDGYAAIDSMAGLLDEMPEDLSEAADLSSRAANSGGLATTSQPESQYAAGEPGAASTRSRLRLARQQSRRVAAGLWKLAHISRASPTALNGPMTGGRRRHALVSLPVPDVRATSRALDTGTNALLLTVIASALERLFRQRGESTGGSSFRVMVPRTVRTYDNRHAMGNITAAVPIDLPIGPMAPRARLAEVAALMKENLDGGQPEATRFLMKAMGVLPAPVHAWAARAAYHARWFNGIVSVIPGPRRPQSFAGVKLTGVYPILPMADGVGLAVGLMRWTESFAVGLTGDATLVSDIDELAEAVRDAFAEFHEATRE